MSLGVGFVVMAGALNLMAPSDASAAVFSSPRVVAGTVPPEATLRDGAPWIAGGLAGVLAGALVAWRAGRTTRESLRRALEQRRQALQALWAEGAEGHLSGKRRCSCCCVGSGCGATPGAPSTRRCPGSSF